MCVQRRTACANLTNDRARAAVGARERDPEYRRAPRCALDRVLVRPMRRAESIAERYSPGTSADRACSAIETQRSGGVAKDKPVLCLVRPSQYMFLKSEKNSQSGLVKPKHDM